jgi:hypothetical protein
MSEKSEGIIVIWFGACVLVGGYLGYQNSGATGIGGAIVGALSAGFIAFSLVGFFAPRAYIAWFRRRGEVESEVFLSPIGAILGVSILVMAGFFFKFLLNEDFWYRMIILAIGAGLAATIRLAGVRGRSG